METKEVLSRCRSIASHRSRGKRKMQINTLHDLHLLMFAFILPIFSAFMLFGVGLYGVLMEILRDKKSHTVKFVCVITGCIIMVWFFYTWKSGETTEANRALIRRLERDYREIQEEIREIQLGIENGRASPNNRYD